MKKLISLSLVFIVSLIFCGTVSAAPFFWDSVLGGGHYTLDGSNRTMDLYVQTEYSPYNEDGTYLSGSGAGTILDWHFSAVFDSNYDLINDGFWEESWGSNSRIGLFDEAFYVRTGKNGSGQNIGTFSAEWSLVEEGTPLAPTGPWFADLDITRTTASSDSGVYMSSGTVTGFVGNDPPAPVPEPSTFLLLGSGLAGLGFYTRKRKKA